MIATEDLAITNAFNFSVAFVREAYILNTYVVYDLQPHLLLYFLQPMPTDTSSDATILAATS
jgi:hypothetical protein